MPINTKQLKKQYHIRETIPNKGNPIKNANAINFFIPLSHVANEPCTPEVYVFYGPDGIIYVSWGWMGANIIIPVVDYPGIYEKSNEGERIMLIVRAVTRKQKELCGYYTTRMPWE